MAMKLKDIIEKQGEYKRLTDTSHTPESHEMFWLCEIASQLAALNHNVSVICKKFGVEGSLDMAQKIGWIEKVKAEEEKSHETH